MSINPNSPPEGNDPAALPPKLREVLQLISALCDESITLPQCEELQTLVCNDPEIRKFYVRMIHLHSGLYYFASALPDMVEPSIAADGQLDLSDDSPQAGMYETMMLPAMRAPDELEDESERFLPAPVTPAGPGNRSGAPPLLIKGGIAAAILVLLGLAAVVLPSIFNNSAHVPVAVAPKVVIPEPAPVLPPVVPMVATIELESKPDWLSVPAHDGGFAVDDALKLAHGAVQLKFANGGRLVVEGPAELHFVSDAELQLNAGRIVANYPGGGLTVRCPTGLVKDLGTEFGVAVNPQDGHSDVEVFQGTVSAALSSDAATQPSQPVLLKAGQAAVLSEHNLTPNSQGAIPQRFICNLSNQQVNSLNVVDLICGGDGTTRRRGIAVDSLTGAAGVLQPVGLRNGDHLYHRVMGYPVIDGVFIPDGSVGPMTVDSTGHQFGFSVTTDQTTNEIWTGGPIPWADELGISTVLEGRDYAGPEHSILCTHCNNGITLDLDAIRRIYPDRLLSRFLCRFGNSYVNGLKGAVKLNPVSNVAVLLDGKIAYEKRNFSNRDGTFAVDVPLNAGKRFLTLAAVDDGKDIDRDWILWTDAQIDLVTGK